MTTLPDTITLRTAAPGAAATLSRPADVAEALEMAPGAVLRAVATPDGLLLRRADANGAPDASERAEVMEIFEEFSAQYQNALRELAK